MELSGLTQPCPGRREGPRLAPPSPTSVSSLADLLFTICRHRAESPSPPPAPLLWLGSPHPILCCAQHQGPIPSQGSAQGLPDSIVMWVGVLHSLIDPRAGGEKGAAPQSYHCSCQGDRQGDGMGEA